jgi:hypothetical protein
MCWQDGYPITGRVWFRESTDEWVLELNGIINDSGFTSRHTYPKDAKPEDVPGLSRLYEELEELHVRCQALTLLVKTRKRKRKKR